MPSPAPAPHAPPRRLVAVDLVRAAAVLGVVVVHTGHWPVTSTAGESTLWDAVILLSRFSVPCFVILTGVVLEYGRCHERAAGAGVARRRGPWVRRRLRRSMVPWLAWAPLYLALGLTLAGGVTPTPWGVADWLIGGGGHLYFLLLVPQLSMLALVWPRRLRTQVVLAVAAVAAQTALGLLRFQVDPGDGATAWALLWHATEELPFWVGYLAVGIAAGQLAATGWRPSPGQHRLALGLLPVAAVAGAVVLLRTATPGGPAAAFATGTGAFLLPAMPLLVLPVTAWVAALSVRLPRHPRVLRAVQLVADEALGVYAVQALVINLPGHLLATPLEGGWVEAGTAFIVLTVATLGLSLAAARLLGRSPLAPMVGRSWHGARSRRTVAPSSNAAPTTAAAVAACGGVDNAASRVVWKGAAAHGARSEAR